MEMEPRVSIIVLNWNRYDDTAQCLRSLQNISFKNKEIIVVDNGSKDLSTKRIRQEFPDVILIENKKNLGFAAGNNVGIKYALAKNVDYVLLLNNDTIVDKEFLARLVQALEIDSKAGIAAPKIYFYGSRGQTDILWCAGTKLNLLYGKPLMLGYKQKDDGGYDVPTQIPWASGCAMMVKKCVFQDIGYLDSEYLSCLEDVDFCIRATRSSYKIFYIPQARIWHKESVSFKSINSPFYVYLQTRNRLLLMRKNGRWLAWMFFVPHFLISTLKRMIFLLWRKEINSIKAIFLGIYDFCLGRIRKTEFGS